MTAATTIKPRLLAIRRWRARPAAAARIGEILGGGGGPSKNPESVPVSSALALSVMIPPSGVCVWAEVSAIRHGDAERDAAVPLEVREAAWPVAPAAG
jgi:hypothetical protein